MSSKPAATALDDFHEKNKSATAFIGHPWGLAWLSASEFWERFCFYGMQALLVLYLTKYLLQPEHIGQVWGFETYREMLRWLGHQIPWLFGNQTQMVVASNTAQSSPTFAPGAIPRPPTCAASASRRTRGSATSSRKGPATAGPHARARTCGIILPHMPIVLEGRRLDRAAR